jgi:hypothetical protein
LSFACNIAYSIPLIARSARRLVPVNPDVAFILGNAERLIKVASTCVISFGLADGLREAVNASPDESDDWKQASAGFQGDNLMMTALRTALLLDRDETKLSLQAIYRGLKEPDVRAGLLRVLSERHGDDDLFVPARTGLIDEFFQTYSEIDWQVHSRLTHFRNLGIAHLTPEKMSKSVTFGELRTMVEIIGRLAITLQRLCQNQTALRTDTSNDYRKFAREAMMRRPTS